MTATTTLSVNGQAVSATVEPRTHLADFLRESLNLTATHIGCEHGVCGACTLFVDGRPVRSCLTFAVSCGGADVRTIEGLQDDPVMASLRQAFTAHHALQCGYCTPGMLATAYDIVTRLPDADEARIREELAGNLCRCTGYAGIVEAIRDVLTQGPHLRGFAEVTRAATPGAFAQAPALAALAVPEPSAAPQAGDADDEIVGGVTLSRSVTVQASQARLWSVISDPFKVAQCFPGAQIDSVSPEGMVAGAFTVSIGAVSARFAGRGKVAFDAVAKSGMVSGVGDDGASRSRAQGRVAFSTVAEGEDASLLVVDITYKIIGPLAQFARAGLIAEIVDRLLKLFAANVQLLAEGKEVSTETGGFGLSMLLGAMLAAVRRALFRS